ncbi:phospholipase A [soil metagenome]
MSRRVMRLSPLAWWLAAPALALAQSSAGTPKPAAKPPVKVSPNAAVPAAPGTPDPLAHCAEIGPSADRLACYDKLAGRAVAPPTVEAAASTAAPAPKASATVLAGSSSATATPTAASSAASAAVPTTTTLAATDTSATQAKAVATSSGLMSKFWELDAEDKRGIFNFTGYKANYVLPVHFTTRINRSPQSPTQAAVATPDYRHVEAKIQLSLRTKLVQGLLFPGADLWVAYTQQSLWQLYNGADSKPFRNTDYEPEVMYVVPVPEPVRYLPFGWQWRYAQVALAHQSNGQSDPLSRSWNRVYFGAGFERGDMSLTAHVIHRLKENIATDNNPDLESFRGRGDVQFSWTPGAATAAITYRNSFRNGKRGAILFEGTYPVYRDQPNGLRWYVQAFNGYGETLTDYNFRQTSFGAGLTFLQF